MRVDDDPLEDGADAHHVLDNPDLASLRVVDRRPILQGKERDRWAELLRIDMLSPPQRHVGGVRPDLELVKSNATVTARPRPRSPAI